MLRAVLVPLDGSELGEAALPWAVRLAQAHGFGLALARVVPFPVFAMTGGLDGYVSPEIYQQVVDDELEAARTYLQAVRDRLATQGLSVETHVREGNPADGVLDLADEVGAFAVAMATHGRGGLGRLVIGSVAERVVQQSTRPVLLVRPQREAALEPALRRLLVPLDGSPLAERALEVARELATDESELILVRAVAAVERVVTDTEGSARIPDEAATQRAVERATEYLRRVVPDGSAAGSIRTEVRVGRPADEIEAVARDLRADLIVMSTHGHTGPARWLLGSIADEVVRRAERPVLLVSSRAAAARLIGPYSVQDVMSRDLAVVQEDEPLVSALHKLLRRRVSGMPVVNAAGELVGVLSELDLLAWQDRLRQAAAAGAAVQPAAAAQRLESDRVREVMTQPAITIAEGAPLSEALRVFIDRRLRRLPVTREGKLVGILTRADVLKALAAGPEAATTRPD